MLFGGKWSFCRNIILYKRWGIAHLLKILPMEVYVYGKKSSIRRNRAA